MRFLSGGFTTMTVMNSLERKLANRTSEHSQGISTILDPSGQEWVNNGYFVDQSYLYVLDWLPKQRRTTVECVNNKLGFDNIFFTNESFYNSETINYLYCR